MIGKLLFLFCLSSLIYGCRPQKTVTLWKTPKTILPSQKKIVVVGIIKDSNDSMRIELEDGLVKNLQSLGYYATSSFREFGKKGLSDLSQEATFIKLCNNGVDAVLTIALLDKLKQEENNPGRFSQNTNYHYYNRIWNYRNMQADLTENKPDSGTFFLGEGILFDLRTLEPLHVVQTRPIQPDNKNIPAYLYPILNKMKKEKILVKQNNKALKSF